MKKTNFDAAAWLKSNCAGRGGVVCSICASPELSERVDTILKASAKTGLRASISRIHSHLVEAFNYSYTEAAVSNHLRRHVEKDVKQKKGE